MRLSMYTGYVQNTGFTSFDEGLRAMYKSGIRHGDIVDAEFNEIHLLRYLEHLNYAGIMPNALVATQDIASVYERERNRNLAAVKEYVDLLEKYKVPYLMATPSVKEARSEEEFYVMRERLAEGFAELVDYAKGSGVKICMENQSVSTRADSKIDDIAYILKNVNGLGYTLDSGNFFCVGEDAVEAYERFKDRLVYAHFKDWKYDIYGGFVRENMPRFEGCVLGNGLVPLTELARRFKEDKKDICVTLEINSNGITADKLTESACFMSALFATEEE